MSATQTAPPMPPLLVQSSSLASPEPSRGRKHRHRPSLEAMPPPPDIPMSPKLTLKSTPKVTTGASRTTSSLSKSLSPPAGSQPPAAPLLPPPPPQEHYQHRMAGTSQMTLAISRSDATRMLDASRKFNIEISRIQDEEWAEIEAWEREEQEEKTGTKEEESGSGGVGAKEDKKKGVKSRKGSCTSSRKGKANVKKDKDEPENDGDERMVDAAHNAAARPNSRNGETSTSKSSEMVKSEAEKNRAEEDEKRSPSPTPEDAPNPSPDESARTQSSPPPSGEPQPPKRTSTNALRREGAARNREQLAASSHHKERRRRRRRPTPLHLLLISAAERCDDGLISSYLHAMRAEGRTEKEIEACLLLFLDVDKSTKLVTSFEVMGGRRKRRRNENKTRAGSVGGTGNDKNDDGVKAAMMLNLEDAMDMDESAAKDGATPTTKMDDGLYDLCLSPKMDADDIDVLPTVSASVDEADPVIGSPKDLKSSADCTLERKSHSDSDTDDDEEEEATAPPSVTHEDMRSLFRCFLTSISTCIHHDGANKRNDTSATGAGDAADGSASRKARKSDDSHSPRSVASSKSSKGGEGGGTPREWVLSGRTKREIEGIASFAAECLAEFVQKRDGGHSGASEKARDAAQEAAGRDDQSEHKGDAKAERSPSSMKSPKGGKPSVVSFEAFGDWYNSGGFSLVPWLELLDLSKWDFASRAAAAAAAAAASSERFHKRRTPRKTPGIGGSNSFDDGMPPMMGGIAEDDGFLPDLPSLPRSLKRLAGDEPDPNFRCSGGTARNLFSPSDVPANPHSSSGGAGDAGERKSRTVVSFDFTGAMPPGSNGAHRPFHICITEENLRMLKGLVNRTGLSVKNPDAVAEVLLRHATSQQMGDSTDNNTGAAETAMMLHRDDFGRCVREIVPPEQSQAFDRAELENYSNYLTNFFTCFNCTRCSSTKGSGEAAEAGGGSLGPDYANAKELAVGFSFLCAGNKSTKLATAFELLDDGNSGHLTRRKLAQYLRSYLTMLVGISLLSESTAQTTETRRALLGFCASHGAGGSRRNRDPKTADMFTAVENGARWTQQQFLRTYEAKLKNRGDSGDATGKGDKITFEDFAEWYTEGGYTVAPWLELLDLSKFLSLINDLDNGEDRRDRPIDDAGGYPSDIHGHASSAYGRNNLSTPRMHTPASNGAHRPPSAGARGGAASPPAEILFTFPLANRQSLVVLREDAIYVRSVVQQLGLLSMAPEGAWDSLYGFVRTRPVPASMMAQNPGGTMRPPRGAAAGKGMDVDQPTFVRAMQALLPNMNRLPPTPTGGPGEVTSTPTETLQNFFQSFDLDQIGLVAANELMGGLALLCGGKKSSKLAFAFGLFDGREDNKKGKGKKKKKKRGSSASSTQPPPHSLDGTELFLFLRSLLIVLFSCCRQSLHLSAEAVSRYIYDTAHTVAEDVMQYRRRRHRKGIGSGDAGRVDFDEFGEWYNEGGFETAPWLELLDLHKWVLLEDVDKPNAAASATGGTRAQELGSPKKSAASVLPSPTPRTKKKSGIETPSKHKMMGDGRDMLCPPPPPDDAIDPNTDPFFGEDIDMGGIDDMDFNILGESTAKGKENDGDNPMTSQSLPATPGRMTPGLGMATPGMDITLPSPSPRTNSPPPQLPRAPIPTPPLPSPPPAPRAPELPQAPEPAPAPKPQPAPDLGPAPASKKQEHKASSGNGRSNSRRAPQPPPPHPPPPPQPSTSLKFHLLTSEEHGGYVVSISQTRIRRLRHLVIDSGLYKVDVTAACGRIVDRAISARQGGSSKGGSGAGAKSSQPSSSQPSLLLSKDRFDSAMRRVVALSKSRMTTETQRSLSDLLTTIYRAFEASSGRKNEVDALELASGFTILCGGRKSDKLEHAFDLILDADSAKSGGGAAPVDGQYDRKTMARYLRSFLTILLSVATCKALDGVKSGGGLDDEVAVSTMKGGRRCDNVRDAILLGSDWAASQVFDALAGSNNGGKKRTPSPSQQLVGFDDFADWYTKGGYTSIPWLELLDLRKWVLTAPQQQQPCARQPPPR